MKNILSALLLFVTTASFSQDRIFNYTYQSPVFTKGQYAVELWNTFHWKRIDYYRQFDHRMAYEAGLNNKLQTAFYLSMSTRTSLVSDIVLQGQTYVATSSFETDLGFSFSNEWKYKFSDAEANALGAAVSCEIGISETEFGLEGRVILDKKAGKFTHAFNLVVQPVWSSEIKNGKVEQEMNFSFEEDYGLMYNISTPLYVGFEIRNLNKTTKEDGLLYSTLFAGPGLAYVSGKFWINATVMPQVAGLFHQKENGFTDGLELNDHERLETRLLFSYSF